MATEEQRTPWLNSWNDRLCNLNCEKSCFRFVDLDGDGETSLVIGFRNQQLKVYKGTSFSSMQSIPGVPSSICDFHISQYDKPIIAIASGPTVYLYRDLRPYGKFSVPPVEVTPEEQTVWTDLKNRTCDINTATKVLASTRDAGKRLSSQALEFLALEKSPAMQSKFVLNFRGQPSLRTLITCMETLKKVGDSGKKQSSNLILGTESRLVLIVDPATTKTICSVELPSVPVFIEAVGEYDIDWCILIACRDAKIYTLYHDSFLNKIISKPNAIELETHTVGFAVIDKNVFVATMDSQMHCFNMQGNKLFSIRMPARISSLETMKLNRSRFPSIRGVLVSLDNGTIRCFNDNKLLHILNLDGSNVNLIRFGQYSREENTLAIVTKNGELIIKMLQRNAVLDLNINDSLMNDAAFALVNSSSTHNHKSSGNVSSVNHGKAVGLGKSSGGSSSNNKGSSSSNANGGASAATVPSPAQFAVVRKSQLVMDQSAREKAQAVDMHRAFQKDLCKLRLRTAQTYLDTLQSSSGTDVSSSNTSITLNVQVQGLGPFFKLKLDIINNGDIPISQIPLIIVYNHEIYKVIQSRITIPILLPGLLLSYSIDIESIIEDNVSLPLTDVVRVLVLNNNSKLPYASVAVTMPQSDVLD